MLPAAAVYIEGGLNLFSSTCGATRQECIYLGVQKCVLLKREVMSHRDEHTSAPTKCCSTASRMCAETRACTRTRLTLSQKISSIHVKREPTNISKEL